MRNRRDRNDLRARTFIEVSAYFSRLVFSISFALRLSFVSTPGVDVGLLIRPCKDMEVLQIYEFKRSYRVGVDIDLVFHFRGIELVNSLLKYAL
jgi:hypothetical protein